VKAALKLNKQFLWPVAGMVTAALLSINPFYHPHLTLQFGIAAWFVDVALVLVLSAHPRTAPTGALTAGLLLIVPAFLWESPLARGLLMCCMALPLALAALPLFGPANANFRERMACFFTWLGTRQVERRPRSLDKAALLHLFTSTLIFAAAMVSVKATPPAGLWLLARWFTGGIMILALAEMVTAGHNFVTALFGIRAPGLMQSPSLSASVAEFWTRRWNPAASALLFQTLFFKPLSRRGPALALWTTFLASAIAHVMIPYMALGKLPISLVCGTFFLVQPLLILTERRINVRRWPRPAARAWTLGALTITSPLFVEPVLQILEPSWGPADGLVVPTLLILAFALGVNLLFALGSLAAGSELSGPRTALQPQRF
jgi:hypothetical protein